MDLPSPPPAAASLFDLAKESGVADAMAHTVFSYSGSVPPPLPSRKAAPVATSRQLLGEIDDLIERLNRLTIPAQIFSAYVSETLRGHEAARRRLVRDI